MRRVLLSILSILPLLGGCLEQPLGRGEPKEDEPLLPGDDGRLRLVDGGGAQPDRGGVLAPDRGAVAPKPDAGLLKPDLPHPPPQPDTAPPPPPGCNLPPRDCSLGSAACAKLVPFAPSSHADYFVSNGVQWAYLRQDTMMLIKYAAAAVSCYLPGNKPIGLGDMSDVYGKTPADSGGLRHPSGTHDNGRDVDVAYYQTGQPDNALRPVCPHTSGGAEVYHCTGAPTILDLPRTALFIGRLLESSRVRVIGVDGQIGPLVKSEIAKLVQQGLVTPAAQAKLSSKLGYETSNGGAGWYKFHHHHLHLSTLTSGYSLEAPSPPSIYER